MDPKPTTIDGLLNKRILVEQPAKGFRIAVDTVLLAAAVPALAGQRVLDMGCGVGGAMLALGCRMPDVFVTGLEIQSEFVTLCRANIERNKMTARLDVIEGDATQLPSRMVATFDHVMMNPPYHDTARHDVSDHRSTRLANASDDGDLELWVGNVAKALRNGGVLTLIHRADRLDEIMKCLAPEFGGCEIKPIQPKILSPPKRVIVRAVKGEAGTRKAFSSLILHEDNGAYTAAADDILREAKAFVF